MSSLCRLYQGLSFQNFCDVQIEEVTVQDSLHTASYDGNEVIEPLKVESVDPVKDVQPTVGA